MPSVAIARVHTALVAMAAIAFTLLVNEEARAQTTYDIPTVEGVPGVPVDGCASWQADCGQPAADQFCRSQGFAQATQWEWAYDFLTWNIGSNRYCDRARDNIRCGGLRNVVCTAASAPTDNPDNGVTADISGSWQGSGWGNVEFWRDGDGYRGTYSDTMGLGGIGNIELGADLIGTWWQTNHSGTMSVEIVDQNNLRVPFSGTAGSGTSTLQRR